MRYASIDLLRSAAIVLMVVVHFLENLSGYGWAPAGFGAPMFGFLVGVSYRIWLDLQHSRGRSDAQITATTVRRGLFIFGLGLAFNVFAWLPADLFNWDVLTLIGSAILLLAAVRDQPAVVPLSICAAVFVLNPVLTANSGYRAYWLEGYFDPHWTIRDVTLGYVVNGYFPLFPWLMFPLLGYVVGGRALPAAGGRDAADAKDPAATVTWSRVRPIALAGVAFLMLELALRLTRPYQTGWLGSQVLRGWTMFPASVEYLTTVLGTVLLAFALALWLVDGRGVLDRFPRFVAVTRTMSQHSLSLYVLHHVIHLWPLWIYGAIKGPEATHYWRLAMPVAWSAALSVPAVVLMYFAARWMSAGRRVSFESLMRRWCDGGDQGSARVQQTAP